MKKLINVVGTLIILFSLMMFTASVVAEVTVFDSPLPHGPPFESPPGPVGPFESPLGPVGPPFDSPPSPGPNNTDLGTLGGFW